MRLRVSIPDSSNINTLFEIRSYAQEDCGPQKRLSGFVTEQSINDGGADDCYEVELDDGRKKKVAGSDLQF